MNLHSLPKTTHRSAKRIGRGIGSGKGGHQSTRGQKGQKARGGISQAFEGTKTKKSMVKRIPMQRGKGKQKSWQDKTEIINLGDLVEWDEKNVVSSENLIKFGLVRPDTKNVKLLANGEVTKKLTVEIKASKQAVEKLCRAGGKMVV